MRRRVLSGILACVLWSGLTVTSSASDMEPYQGASMSEATVFFSKLAKTSSNPIIANFARENLQKLQTSGIDNLLALADPVGTKPIKTLAVVSLLPQADNTYVVPAVVNKKFMATFLVDTGASYTVITPQMAESLGVDLSAKDTQTVPVTTANGTVQAPLVVLDKVSLGGMQVENVQAVVADLGDAPQLSGLLGMSFFQGMEISFKQDKLVLSR